MDEEIIQMELGELKDFRNHTFQVRDDDSMKKLVESGELQRSMMYECESDIHIPSAKRKARRITATIMRIE